MEPGWYADPFSRYGMRWWDGAAWTSYTAGQEQWSGHPGQPGMPRGPQFDPARDLADEQRAAARAVYGVLLIAGTAIVSYLLSAALLHHALHDFVHRVREAMNDNTGASQYTGWNSASLVLQGFGLLNLAAQIIFWIWLYRAATVARRAGLPARRDPVWAWLGFIVPIVNFWFPYQVARDTLPAGHRGRALVTRWWLLWIAQTLASIPVAVVAYFSTAAALVTAVAACALPILTAVTARPMIAEITAAHRELVASAS